VMAQVSWSRPPRIANVDSASSSLNAMKFVEIALICQSCSELLSEPQVGSSSSEKNPCPNATTGRGVSISTGSVSRNSTVRVPCWIGAPWASSWIIRSPSRKSGTSIVPRTSRSSPSTVSDVRTQGAIVASIAACCIASSGSTTELSDRVWNDQPSTTEDGSRSAPAIAAFTRVKSSRQASTASLSVAMPSRSARKAGVTGRASPSTVRTWSVISTT